MRSWGFMNLQKSHQFREYAIRARKQRDLPEHPVAIVTGASRGIGKAIAIALGEAGCKVVVNFSSNEAAALEVCEEIKLRGKINGGDAVAIQGNVGKVEDVEKLMKKTLEQVRYPYPYQS